MSMRPKNFEMDSITWSPFIPDACIQDKWNSSGGSIEPINYDESLSMSLWNVSPHFCHFLEWQHKSGPNCNMCTSSTCT